MYFITTKRMLEVCFFQHTPTFIIEPKELTDTEENSDHTENDACDGCSAECPPAFGDDRETDRADSADDRNRECETAERQEREDTADQGHRCK